jgi:hypothetical protein
METRLFGTFIKFFLIFMQDSGSKFNRRIYGRNENILRTGCVKITRSFIETAMACPGAVQAQVRGCKETPTVAVDELHPYIGVHMVEIIDQVPRQIDRLLSLDHIDVLPRNGNTLQEALVWAEGQGNAGSRIFAQERIRPAGDPPSSLGQLAVAAGVAEHLES